MPRILFWISFIYKFICFQRSIHFSKQQCALCNLPISHNQPDNKKKQYLRCNKAFTLTKRVGDDIIAEMPVCMTHIISTSRTIWTSKLSPLKTMEQFSFQSLCLLIFHFWYYILLDFKLNMCLQIKLI